MNFPELMIRNTYKSYHEDNILTGLVSECLPHAVLYRQMLESVSTESLQSIFPGLFSMMRAGGSIRLLLLPDLSLFTISEDEDVDYIDSLKLQLKNQ